MSGGLRWSAVVVVVMAVVVLSTQVLPAMSAPAAAGVRVRRNDVPKPDSPPMIAHYPVFMGVKAERPSTGVLDTGGGNRPVYVLASTHGNHDRYGNYGGWFNRNNYGGGGGYFYG